MNEVSSNRIHRAALSTYTHPAAGNTERFVAIRPAAVAGPTQSAYQALRDYTIRDFGQGLPAAETILRHLVENKLRRPWRPQPGLWHRTVVLPVQCDLVCAQSGASFATLRPSSVEDISRDLVVLDGELRRSEVESYARQIRSGTELGPPLYVTGAVLNMLGADVDAKAVYMMDGARRTVAAALNHRRTLSVLLLLGEEEYGALLPPADIERLKQRLASLRWFQNYQSIPLAGLRGERSLNRFSLMDLALLRDQTILDFGCNTGQSAIKAVQAGARQVVGVEGMRDTWEGAVEIARLTGFQNLRYLNVNFNDADFDSNIDGQFPESADYSFFFSVYRTKELMQRDRLFQYIINKTRKGIFFEGHAHPKIDTLEYYDWLFDSFGLSHQFLGNSEGELRPLFFLDLSKAKRRVPLAFAQPDTFRAGQPLINSTQRGVDLTNLPRLKEALPESSGSGTPRSQGDTAVSSALRPRFEIAGWSRNEPAVLAPNSEPASRYRVSAIVSTYRSEKFIEGRLKDLLDQTLGDQLEIVVVDSGSPENEGAIVKRYQEKHSNIQYIRTEERENVYQAWNRGIRAASGQCITNANTDDRLRPDALEILAAELDRHPQAGLVYADFFITGSENMEFGSHIRTGYSVKPDYAPSIMLSGCHMGPQPMWRRAVHREIGYFDESFFAAGDYEFWCRLALRYPLKRVPQFLGLYLHNGEGVSNSNLQRSLSEAQRVQQLYQGRFPPPAGNLPTGYYYRQPVTPGRFVNIGMVTFNRLEFTRQAIDSIVQFTNFPYALTVVDNNSQDGTQEYLAELKRQGVIKNLLLLPENVGIARASNLAWQQEPAAAHYLKFDNDVVIQKPDWLLNMVTVADAVPELAALGYNFEPVSYPVESLQGFPIRVKRNANLGGACYLIPKRAEQALGYWCEDYGLYGEEDHDHSVRLRLAGFLNAYMEDEDIGIHLPGGKAGKIDPISHRTDDASEQQLHFDYRAWKDQLRAQLIARGGIFQRNQSAYTNGHRSLYMPRGRFAGILGIGIQVFDQDDTLLFLTVSSLMNASDQQQIADWARNEPLDSDNTECYEQHGRTFMRIKKQTGGTDSPLVLCQQGETLLNAGDIDKALKLFDQALRKEPNLLGAHHARAVCLEQLHRYKDAEGAARKELERQPRHQGALDLLQRLRTIKRSSVPACGLRPGGPPPLRVAVLSNDEMDSNCAQLRLVLPLSRNPGIEVTWAIEFRGYNTLLIPGVVERADLVVVQRLFATPKNLHLINAAVDLGKPLIYEADDLLLNIPPGNPHHVFAMSCRAAVLETISKAAAVTVSTEPLKAALSAFNPNVQVVPNLINEALWTQIRPVGAGRVVIGFTGTTTHQADLAVVEETLWKIAEKYGDLVQFNFMGCATESIQNLPGLVFTPFQTAYDAFARRLQTNPMDIALVPLEDTPFNRCKSNIKWLEYSACGIAGIYSDLAPYNSCVANGKTGVLVGNTTREWFQVIDELIQNPARRNTLGLAARQEVLSNYTLASKAHLYGDVYQRVIDNHRRGRDGSQLPVALQGTAAAPRPSPVTPATLGGALEAALQSNPRLQRVIERVKRYVAEGRSELACRIVKKELADLPEYAEIVARLSEPDLVPTS